MYLVTGNSNRPLLSITTSPLKVCNDHHFEPAIHILRTVFTASPGARGCKGNDAIAIKGALTEIPCFMDLESDICPTNLNFDMEFMHAISTVCPASLKTDDQFSLVCYRYRLYVPFVYYILHSSLNVVSEMDHAIIDLD